MLKRLSIDVIDRDPGQPRKAFDRRHIEELAASIETMGLQQPITVRPAGDGRYQIVMGECRWRAHQLIQERSGDHEVITILCHVRRMDDATKAIAAIAENMTRQDITPLEEAYAFRDAMEICKLDAAGLGERLGRQTWRIEERLSLLKLLPEYQELFSSGNLGASEAFEMSRQTTANQRKLFKLISGGQVANYNQLRQASCALLEADNQVEFFPDLGGPTKDEQKAINALDKRIDQITALLQVGFNAKNEITILQKVAPGKAEQTAEKLNLIASQVQLLAAALRERQPQQEDLPAAAA